MHDFVLEFAIGKMTVQAFHLLRSNVRCASPSDFHQAEQRNLQISNTPLFSYDNDAIFISSCIVCKYCHIVFASHFLCPKWAAARQTGSKSKVIIIIIIIIFIIITLLLKDVVLHAFQEDSLSVVGRARIGTTTTITYNNNTTNFRSLPALKFLHVSFICICHSVFACHFLCPEWAACRHTGVESR